MSPGTSAGPGEALGLHPASLGGGAAGCSDADFLQGYGRSSPNALRVSAASRCP